MRLKLRKWDIAEHLMRKPGSIILLLGKRGTGKSHMMGQLAHTYASNGNIDLAVGFSPTHETNRGLAFIPESLIFPEFDEAVVDRIVQHQRKCMKDGRELKRVVLFLDDCGYDSSSIFKSKCIKNLFYNGRHYRIAIVIALQYAVDMGPAFRANVDVVMTMRNTIQGDRERLWKNYFGQFETFRHFCAAMDKCTENFSALVSANNLSQSNELNDSVFWYRAPRDVPEVTVGCAAIQSCNRLCYEDMSEVAREEQRDDVHLGDEQGNTLATRAA